MTRKSGEARRLAAMLDRLSAAQPAPQPGLTYRNPWECLVATLLSAQCTDRRVNLVTPPLFAAFPDPPSLAAASVAAVEALIRSVGLYRSKARNLVETARIVTQRHAGRVPGERAALEALPGVGRKTASVVLAQAFGVPAFAVDTHVGRVCRRWGFSPSSKPLDVERRIAALLPEARWRDAHLLIIRHGRVTCHARKPACGDCAVADLCPSRA